MNIIDKIRKIPRWQKIRYGMIIISCNLFFAPFLLIPGLFNSKDFCGVLCLRRFYLYYPGMTFDDLSIQVKVSIAGVFLLLAILVVTFFFGRLWCSFICPVGGSPELVSRSLNDRIKIEYRTLPQIAIRYGYFGFYLVMMPMLGISACTLCNFVTLPRIFEAIGGGKMGPAFLLSSIGIVNLALVVLLGFLANKGRAYCAFLCPIGAIDGLVNRLGASFRFTRRIRVERSRCVGCTACAQACMCGAIEMIDGKSTVDQLSCMSCHECVDVCNRGAIEYLVVPPSTRRHRRRRDEVLPPLPVWTGIYRPAPGTGIRGVRWQRVFFGVALAMVVLFIAATQGWAAPRRVDPDGCLTCHALRGLDYIDESGVRRSSTIDESHYYSSLHGSVPCRDCHRKIRDYPHRVANGEVDCAESCHVQEPSKGDKYSHKKLVEEFKRSVHGSGRTKGFTGGNRLEESTVDDNPSCRKCHSNTPYIGEEKMSRFRELFTNCDRECGRCHHGQAWREQFGGHILRRLLGGRWSKKEENSLCNDCHEDRTRMAEVEIEDRETGEKRKAGPRFILATKSYEMTLHSKMMKTAGGESLGASCIDCHSPTGYRHDVRRSDDPASSTHVDRLASTCGAKGCHTYSKSPLNAPFIKTDMHSLDLIPPYPSVAPVNSERLSSNWFRGGLILIPVAIVVTIANLWWGPFIRRKGKIWPVMGGDLFQRRMLKREPQKKIKKRKRKRKANIVILCLVPAALLYLAGTGAAESIYIEMAERAEVTEKELAEARKAVEEYKEVPKKDPLPLKPYHKRVEPRKPERESFCTTCHGVLPHGKDERFRTFLNMHVTTLSCEVCHFTPAGVDFEYRRLSHSQSPERPGDSGGDPPLPERKEVEMIVPFHENEAVSIFREHPFSGRVSRKWKEGYVEERALLKARLHKPLSDKGRRCIECHSTGQKILDFEALGYPPEKAKEIEENRIARFLGKLKRKGQRIQITDLPGQ